MDYLSSIHSLYLQKIFNSGQTLSHPVSAIPTFIFMFSLFLFLFQYFHRTTSNYTRWTVHLQRDFKLHWIHFNISRLWFLLMSAMRKILQNSEKLIDANVEDGYKTFNKNLTYAVVFLISVSMALIPALLIYINFVSRNDMPNFLMWVMDDPYTRHEIGISGHCLERPLRIQNQKHKMKNCPYRSRRSTSFDDNPWLHELKPALICRSCKSLIEQNVVKSMDSLLD